MNEEFLNLEKLTDEQLENELISVKEYKQNMEAMRFYEGVDKTYKRKELEELYKSRPKKKSVNCNLPRLDNTLDGFQGGELIIISGKTGEGKTTLAQSFISDFHDNGDNSLLLSYEVGTEDMLERFKDSDANFTTTDQVKSYDLTWLEKKIWEAIAKDNVKAIFIDHLHYLVDFGSINGNSSLVIGKVMRYLKQLAIKVKLPIFLIAHLAKVQTEAEPTINDIRDSSFIGQEADMVLIIWRKTERDSYISVAKNRRKGTKVALPITLVKGRFVEC